MEAAAVGQARPSSIIHYILFLHCVIAKVFSWWMKFHPGKPKNVSSANYTPVTAADLERWLSGDGAASFSSLQLLLRFKRKRELKYCRNIFESIQMSLKWTGRLHRSSFVIAITIGRLSVDLCSVPSSVGPCTSPLLFPSFLPNDLNIDACIVTFKQHSLLSICNHTGGQDVSQNEVKFRQTEINRECFNQADQWNVISAKLTSCVAFTHVFIRVPGLFVFCLISFHCTIGS